MQTKFFLDENNYSYKSIMFRDYIHSNETLDYTMFDVPKSLQFEFASHKHPHYEIIFPLTDHIEFTVNGKDYLVNKGSALLINAGEVHGHKDAFTKKYGGYACFSFGEKFLFPNNNSAIWEKYFSPLSTGEYTFTKHIKGNLGYEKEIILLLENLRNLSNNIITNSLSIQILLLTIFDIMVKQKAFDANQYLVENPFVLSAIKFIDQYYDSAISVTDIAKNLYISSAYFSKIFKQQVGVCPKEYIVNYRILKFIDKYKSNPKLRVSELALNCGFTDPSYFARAFRNRFGRSPTEYSLSTWKTTQDYRVEILPIEAEDPGILSYSD